MRFDSSYCRQIVAVLILAAFGSILQISAASAQAPQSRYRYVETKRKTETKPEQRRQVGIVRDLQQEASKTVVEQDQIVHYEKIDRPQFESPKLVAQEKTKAVAAKPKQIGLNFQQSSKLNRTIGLRPTPRAATQVAEPIENIATQVQFQQPVEAVNQYPKDAPAARIAQLSAPSVGSQQSVDNSNTIFSDSHPTPFDRFPLRDQYQVFENPANFMPVNYHSRGINIPSSDGIFRVHSSDCCDEWADFCGCKDLDYGCSCGGLKANPGHLGLKWLRSKDACDRTESCRSCGKGCSGCGIKKHGCKLGSRVKSKCGTGCAPASEASGCQTCNVGR